MSIDLVINIIGWSTLILLGYVMVRWSVYDDDVLGRIHESIERFTKWGD